jgi:hypothetical protein
VNKLQLAVLVALGVCLSPPFAFVVGIAWGAWSAYRPRPEIRIRYVERVKPTPSAVPTRPNADLSAR